MDVSDYVLAGAIIYGLLALTVTAANTEWWDNLSYRCWSKLIAYKSDRDSRKEGKNGKRV